MCLYYDEEIVRGKTLAIYSDFVHIKQVIRYISAFSLNLRTIHGIRRVPVIPTPSPASLTTSPGLHTKIYPSLDHTHSP